MKTTPQSPLINFSSGIKVTTHKKIINSAKPFIKNSVEHPWTEKEILKKPSAYTRGVCDCVCGGIKDGETVAMFHLTPTQDNIDNLPSILSALKEKLDPTNKSMQGILLGGASHQRSRILFESLESFMKDHKIQCSVFKEHKHRYANSTILFQSAKDEWQITNSKISKHIELAKQENKKLTNENVLELLKNNFEKVEISSLDNLFA